MTSAPPDILVVEDEPDIAALYARWADDLGTVDVARTRDEAIEKLAPGIQVALVDRRLPDTPGDAVVDEIRDRGLDIRVGMVTAITPTVDVIDLGFDDYLRKPVERDDLRELVTTLQRRARYDRTLQRYYQLVSKHAILTESRSRDRLADEPAFRELEAELDRLEADVADARADLDRADFLAEVKRI